MIKIVTTKTYICDVCKKESNDSRFLKKAPVPGYGDDGEGRMCGCVYPVIELCEECQKKLLRLVDSNFARVHDSCGGIRITTDHIQER